MLNLSLFLLLHIYREFYIWVKKPVTLFPIEPKSGFFKNDVCLCSAWNYYHHLTKSWNLFLIQNLGEANCHKKKRQKLQFSQNRLRIFWLNLASKDSTKRISSKNVGSWVVCLRQTIQEFRSSFITSKQWTTLCKHPSFNAEKNI